MQVEDKTEAQREAQIRALSVADTIATLVEKSSVFQVLQTKDMERLFEYVAEYRKARRGEE